MVLPPLTSEPPSPRWQQVGPPVPVKGGGQPSSIRWSTCIQVFAVKRPLYTHRAMLQPLAVSLYTPDDDSLKSRFKRHFDDTRKMLSMQGSCPNLMRPRPGANTQIRRI